MEQATKALSLITILILSACSGGSRTAGTTIVSNNTPQTGTVFSCSAEPLVSEVDSGAAFTVSVMVSNGTAPYRLNTGSDNATFSTGKAIQVTLQNNATETKTLSGSVQVVDSANASVNCSYSIKVKPANGGLICAQGGGLLFKQSTNSCVQSTTSCQTSDLKAQGYVDVTTKTQCNTYCGALSSACSSLPDTDSLVCSIAARSAGPYYTNAKYEFEIKATRNGTPVELTVGSFSASTTLATSEDGGINPITLGKIRRISVAKSALPAAATAIQTNLIANAWLASDPNVKCGGNSTGAIPQFPVFINRAPTLLCTMEVLNYYYTPTIYAGDNVFIKIAATKGNLPVTLRLDQITPSVAYGSWQDFGIDQTTKARTLAFIWNASIVPSGSTYQTVNMSARARAYFTDTTIPNDWCNDDEGVGGIAGVSFNIYKP